MKITQPFILYLKRALSCASLLLICSLSSPPLLFVYLRSFCSSISPSTLSPTPLSCFRLARSSCFSRSFSLMELFPFVVLSRSLPAVRDQSVRQNPLMCRLNVTYTKSANKKYHPYSSNCLQTTRKTRKIFSRKSFAIFLDGNKFCSSRSSSKSLNCSSWF